MATQNQFRFRKLDTIGATDAEEDGPFLSHCFVDIGDLEALKDCDNPYRLVLGRTGAGKTALLTRLREEQERVISVPPENLAISHISNSNMLNFVSQLGVKLDTFYRLLWRHVFTVEIIKAHFNIHNEADKAGFIENFKNLFRDRKYAQALKYVEEWGKTFWEETDYRIKETTTKLETDLKASIGAALPATLNMEAVERLTEEQKGEVIERAQYVINKVQIKELSQIITALDEILSDPKKRYYIIIDRLDENWIEEKQRYLLIRALIETVRDFRRVRNAKIIVALRYDLLDRVFRLTRDPGFQEEKYESLYLPLTWSRDRLIEVLDARINYLVKQRYTKQTVTYRDLLPKVIEKQPIMDYFLERTMMRPRDVIVFFNNCIAQATNTQRVTVQMLKQAEGEYSRGRLRSLADEWQADYPNLLSFANILKKRKAAFRLDDITDDDCQNFYLNWASGNTEFHDELSAAAEKFGETVIKAEDFRHILIAIFYRVGLVGLKLEPYEATVWSLNDRRSISAAEIHSNIGVEIHPCVWRALGISAK